MILPVYHTAIRAISLHLRKEPDYLICRAVDKYCRFRLAADKTVKSRSVQPSVTASKFRVICADVDVFHTTVSSVLSLPNI